MLSPSLSLSQKYYDFSRYVKTPQIFFIVWVTSESDLLLIFYFKKMQVKIGTYQIFIKYSKYL